MISIFYYKEIMNDTMSIIIRNDKPTRFEGNKDYSKIYKDNVLIGINIFNVSDHIKLENGYLRATREILNLVKNITNEDISSFNEPKFIIASIEKCTPIANTHLNHCKVFNGRNNIDVICGADNVKENIKVVLANVGAALPSGKIINETKIMDINSKGMLCSNNELFNSKEFEKGILILDDNAIIGTEFIEHYKN
ncbi:MAG: YtpR family tRNA-binding protein [Mycoplasmoidaceae bacterium]